MSTITIVGCGLVVVLSYIADSSGTIKLVTSAITVRGITWIVKKVIGSMDKDKADLLNFAGWSLCGFSLVGILRNAIKGGGDVVDNVGGGVFRNIRGLMEFVENVTFWN